MDNPFEMNKDIANMEETAEDMEDFESGLLSRMPSPSPGQKNNRLSEKNATFTKANLEEGGHTRKECGKEGGVDLQSVGGCQLPFGSCVAKKILAEADIELFLMATDGIANQMAGQKKVLVRDIPLGISDREVGAAMREFGKLAVVEFNNQEEATRAVDQWSTLIRKDAVRIYPMIGTQKIIEQRKTWEVKLVGLPQNCTAHYLNTTLDQIKAQSCFILRTSRNYTRMGCAYIGFDSKASCYNATSKLLVIGNTVIHWVLTDTKEYHFCYQIGHLVLKCFTLLKKKKGNTKKVTNNIQLAKLYVRKNILGKDHMLKWRH
ncbi:hypothetical protein G9A89_019782 [Geosiphon pyriformis]|nr:hypothetical protein G9A89_019782 [Geosiphon pyriformis]